MAVLLCTLCVAPAGAVDMKDGTWLAGMDAGLGSAPKKLGAPVSFGGQLLYHPTGAWGWGLQVDRFDFKSKGGVKADMTGILGVVRGNIALGMENWLPYALFGLGYAESRANVPVIGEDRGAGAAFCLGGGADYPLGSNLSLGGEFKLEHLGAGLPKAGVAGATAFALLFRVNLWLLPGGDPFAPGPP